MERRIRVNRRKVETEAGYQIVLQYDMLVDLVPLGLGGEMELYGVAVEETGSGERTSIPAISFRAGVIECLVEYLADALVTPCTLQDVVEDWLAATQAEDCGAEFSKNW